MTEQKEKLLDLLSHYRNRKMSGREGIYKHRLKQEGVAAMIMQASRKSKKLDRAR